MTDSTQTAPMGRTVFISHDANRTGAPFMLLHLCRWLRANTDLEFSIVLRRGGELEREFEAIAPTTVLSRQFSHGEGVIERIAHILGFHGFAEAQARARLCSMWRRENVRLIYSNTATNGEVLKWMRALLDALTISHIHELSFWMSHRMARESLAALLENTDLYVAGADAAKRNLIDSHSVESTRVITIHDFIPTMNYDLASAKTKGELIRRQLNIPESAYIVGAAGTTDWRKGIDLFVHLARSVHVRRPTDVHFIWVGGSPKGEHFHEMRHDLRLLGLDDRVHFVGAREDYVDYISAFDVFALPSREDCFPLVMLEAACLGKPIVCFSGAGGAPEFVEPDAGRAVPYLDIEGMAGQICEMLAHPALLVSLGVNARAKVAQQHDIGVAGRKIFELVYETLSKGLPGAQRPSAKQQCN